MATLQEIEQHYSLCDLADLHDTIDAMGEVEKIELDKAKKRGK